MNVWFRSIPRKITICFIATVKYGSTYIRKRHFNFGKDESKRWFSVFRKTYLIRRYKLFVLYLVLVALLLWRELMVARLLFKFCIWWILNTICRQSFIWYCGLVFVTSTHFISTKHQLKLWAGSNPARGVWFIWSD